MYFKETILKMKIEKTDYECICVFCGDEHDLLDITENENIGVICEDENKIFLICSEKCSTVLKLNGKNYFIENCNDHIDYNAHCDVCNKDYLGTITL